MQSSRVPDGESEGDDHVDAYEAFLRSLNEPTDSDDGAEADGDTGISDEVSAADLDLKARPLPRIPRSVVAITAAMILYVVAAGIVAAVGVVVGPGPVGALAGVVALWPALRIALVLRHHWRVGNTDRALLKLDREAHPRFFLVVDEIMARVGIVNVDVYFAASANAHHAIVNGRSAIIIGYGVFAPYTLTAFRSTVGHELGHASGGDARDADAIAFGVIEHFAKARGFTAPLWRRLLGRVKLDAMRRSRLREHAADFWGGLAAGAGTTEACLVEDRRSGLLWNTFREDLDVLLSAGLRPRSFASLYQRAVDVADETGFGVRPSRATTSPECSHPSDGARVEIAEARLTPFASFDIADAADGLNARTLLDDHVGVGEEVIELAIDLHSGAGDGCAHLDDVADDELWRAYVRALRPRFGQLMQEAFDVPASTPLLTLLPLLRLRAEAGARWFLYEPDDELADDDGNVDATAKVMGWLLDLLGAEDLLVGTCEVGAVRAWIVGGEEQFALTLSIRLGNGDRWDELERMVCWRASDSVQCLGETEHER